INCARSFLSLLSNGSTNDGIGSHPIIIRFLKGIGKTRPPHPRYDSTWDPSIVLSYLQKLEPIDSITLEQLTYKTIGLISLATAHRVQTFSKIQLDEISSSAEGIIIRISAPLKTSKPNSPQPTLYLPHFSDSPSLCVTRALTSYINRTIPFRSDSKKSLFLSFISPHNPVTAQTISRWLKQILKASGVDTNT
ncbi:unnamed protein product, partial [Allacma fusca]